MEFGRQTWAAERKNLDVDMALDVDLVEVEQSRLTATGTYEVDVSTPDGSVMCTYDPDGKLLGIFAN